MKSLLLLLCISLTLAAQERVLLEGSLDGKYPIKMLLFRDGTSARGNYLYRKVGTLIKLSGWIESNGSAELKEFDDTGTQTGSFRGRFARDGSFAGQWISPKGKSLSAILTVSKENDGEFFPSDVHYEMETLSAPADPFHVCRVTSPNVQVEHGLNELISLQKLTGESEDDIRKKFTSESYPMGVVSMSGQVLCNQRYIFSAVFTLEGMGAHLSVWEERVNYDLRRARKLGIGDLLDMQKVGPLIEQIRSELQSRAGQKLSEAAQDGNTDVRDYFEGREFQEQHLQTFSVQSGYGLWFSFSWGLPHALIVYEPDGLVGIRFDELTPYLRADSPLIGMTAE